MKRLAPKGMLVLLAAIAVVGCGKKRNMQSEIEECSSISLDAKGTAQCLVQLYRWKVADAQHAASARHRTLDSLKAWQEDSSWNLDAATHRTQLRNCRRGAEPVDACLLVSGWPLSRVRATTDSLWQAELPQRRRELSACMARKDVNLSSCLTLYYKWDSERALRTADSVTRVRLGGRGR